MMRFKTPFVLVMVLMTFLVLSVSGSIYDDAGPELSNSITKEMVRDDGVAEWHSEVSDLTGLPS